MSSIIEGYNYDVFISYRQKDNKGERWVSEFVEALKTELESTFKEEISVYFDINPHDGLLETHDVDESLKEKLKCLIFIPIISRTYCDPKAFAWEHEFKAFVEQASKDEFGLKVRLPNGNVASRVLPVRIHDLDIEDTKLFEGVMGGAMRTLDFVFKTVSGVNRPLKAKEDHPGDNLNKTYYQDQVNKVALAVREIIHGMKNPVEATKEKSATGKGAERPSKEKAVLTKPVKTKMPKKPVIAAIVLAAILIVLGFLFAPKIFKQKEGLEKSIAVLPFIDDSPEKGNEYIIDGLMDEILNKLQKIKDLNVKSRTSVEAYRDHRKSIQEISKELDANYILEGSGLKIGNKIKITLQLVEGATGNHLWSNPYFEEMDENDLEGIFNIIEDVSFSVANELEAVITPEEEKNIKTNPTNNKEAWDLYLKGRAKWDSYLVSGELYLLEEAKSDLTEAIIKDPQFSLAYAELGIVYVMLAHSSALPPKGYYGNAIKMLKKSIEIDASSGYAYTYLGVTETLYNHDSIAAIKAFNQALILIPDDAQVYADLSFYYSRLGNCQELRNYVDILCARFGWQLYNTPNNYIWKLLICQQDYSGIVQIIEEFEEAGNEYVPTFVGNHKVINAYIQENNYDKALYYADLGIEKIDDPVYGIANKAMVLAMQGDSVTANKILNEILEISNYRYASTTLIAAIYTALGDRETAMEYLDQAIDDRDWRLMDMFEFAPFCEQRDAPWLQDIIKKMWIPIHEEELSQ